MGRHRFAKRGSTAPSGTDLTHMRHANTHRNVFPIKRPVLKSAERENRHDQDLGVIAREVMSS